MEHIFLIHSSGKHSKSAYRLIARIRAASVETGSQCLIRECRHLSDIAAAICRDAVRGGLMRFYVSGSDAALCAAARAASGFPNAEIGILPTPSGSDFVRAYPGADFSDPAAQMRGTARPIDLIECNGQLFVNAVRICVPHPLLFQRPDLLNPPISLAAACDDGTLLSGMFSLAGIGNGPFAGQRRLFPLASPSDGRLDLIVQRARPAGASGLSASPFPIRRQCRRVIVIAQQPMMVCGDREKFYALRLSCSVLRGRVRFVVPAARRAMRPDK